MTGFSQTTVDQAKQTAVNMEAIANSYQKTMEWNRQEYIKDATTDKWPQYIAALSEWQIHAQRATTARLMYEAIAHAYHLTEVWARCKALPTAADAAR
ncbi:hypothetical protein STRATUS_25 [Arthrobacter phage Stratus]|uniref:Uncharacterized protein n=1 Tax=Arthrobacter phage Stratus TaxID=1772317 RepID=A0A0U4IIR0_9CAUD|nr:hypothetical protein STRATUS_25 [Arthrobacter phage Stratus]